jgi:L-asparaginase
MTLPTPDASICVVSTGGTFEKIYDPVSESMTFPPDSCVPGILGKCSAEGFVFEHVMQRDSSGFDETDHDRIASHVVNLQFKRVVLIHGTSSILKTAKAIQRKNAPGVYVLTGAFIPFRYSQIEASFNLGGAIALARYMTRGVYLFMHGEIFDPCHSEKNVEKARFLRRD